MALTATYISATSFTVADDKTTDFIPGRALRMDCGTDGIKYGYVAKSSYSSPNTSVTLDSTDSEAITSNLATVLFSRFKLQDISGNNPLELLWMIRGMQTIAVAYKDSDEFTLKPGVVHIDDGSDSVLYRCEGLDKTVSGLSISTWYYVYVKPPTDGSRIITASEVEYSSTAPTLNSSKQGYYHGTNTSWRCIGFIYTDGSGNIRPFSVSGNEWMFTDYIFTWLNNVTITSSWTDQTAMNVPLGDLQVFVTTQVGAAGTFYFRKNGTSEDSSPCRFMVSQGAAHSLSSVWMTCDADKLVEMKGNTSLGAKYCYIAGFRLPQGM